jgi:hypothetical protein
MNLRGVIACCFIGSLLLLSPHVATVWAGTDPSLLEKSMSDSLDLWREGRYDQLYDRLAHRGKTSREQFAKKMQGAAIRPACCWQKMEGFRVLNEKRTEATVYVRVGLEGLPNSTSSTREFKLTHEEGIWKMQLSDVLSLSGATGKKGKRGYSKKNATMSSYYHQ